jgi:hypothetical protein
LVVRINSEGVRLNQADFILTLMSVFWDEGRAALERFCRMSRRAPDPGGPASPFNHFIQPDPDQLLRVAVAFGFNRGRIKSVYQLLRGKDMETGEFSADCREVQFKVLQDAQAEVLSLTNWHQFLSCLIGAGFRSAEMISSQNALLYAYAFYLIGRNRFNLPEHRLQKLIGRWFFASSLTGRYTGSPETVMDGDLNRLKEVEDEESFAATLEEMMANVLTNDFWTVSLGTESGPVRLCGRAKPTGLAGAVLPQEDTGPARPHDQDEEEIAGTSSPFPACLAGKPRGNGPQEDQPDGQLCAAGVA